MRSSATLPGRWPRRGTRSSTTSKTSGSKDCADGFVAKTDDWEREVEWADIIVFDDVLGHGSKAEALRKAGKLVIGGTAYSDKLEDDRAFGQEELKNAGVDIIPYWEFRSFDEAISFVKQQPGSICHQAQR